MFHEQGAARRKRSKINLGNTCRISHIGVSISKAMEAIIKLIPNRYKATYSKRPRISKNPQINSVKEVNHTPITVRNFGMPLFAKAF